MKTYVTLILAIGCFGNIRAQQRTAEQLAAHVAMRMKDTLDLTDAQHRQVAEINLQIVQNKKSVWARFNGVPDSIRTNVQKMENLRDSFYKAVLTDEQFILYRQKKNKLLNNN